LHHQPGDRDFDRLENLHEVAPCANALVLKDTGHTMSPPLMERGRRLRGSMGDSATVVGFQDKAPEIRRAFAVPSTHTANRRDKSGNSARGKAKSPVDKNELGQ